MSLERELDRLSAGQVEALAGAVAGQGLPDGSLAGAVAGAQPAAVAAVATLAQTWAGTDGLTGAGVALALRAGLRARARADAARSQPVWTGPGASGGQRLTGGVLHELIAGARRRVLILSFATYALPSVTADLSRAVESGCEVDVVHETEADSAGAYSGPSHPFGAVAGIRRWRWPAAQRSSGALLHAKALIVDGERALIGSANLTHRALSDNLEVGVLIRDPGVAGALEAHVRLLMARRTLERVPEL